MECKTCGKAMMKYGRNPSGTQKYKCAACNRIETPEPLERGYGKEKREMAVKMLLDGNSFRSAGRLLGVSHTTVMEWYEMTSQEMPDKQPIPEGEPDVVELDELFTFTESKKTRFTSSRQ